MICRDIFIIINAHEYATNHKYERETVVTALIVLCWVGFSMIYILCKTLIASQLDYTCSRVVHPNVIFIRSKIHERPNFKRTPHFL